MHVLSAFSMLVFVMVCSVVGLRTLRSAARTGGVPEWTIGTGFTCIGLLGNPLSFASGAGVAPAGEVSLSLLSLALFFNGLGVSCFFVFTAYVFRPGARWAQAVAALGVVSIAASSVGHLHALQGAAPETPSFSATLVQGLAIQMVCGACFAWVGIEGVVHWRRGRRRLALGLASPVAVDRFRLWAVFGFSTFSLVLVMVLVIATGQSFSGHPATSLGNLLFGSISAASATLVFFPPERYLARFDVKPLRAR